MIASWFKEKRKSDYSQLLSDGIFEQLITLRESSVANDLVIEFCIETEEWVYDSQQSEYPAYWDRSENIIYYKSRVSKAAVAKALAKPLMRYYKELANWIELVLGATNIDRIIEDNWNVPREVNELFRKKRSPTQNKQDSSSEEKIGISVESEDVKGDGTEAEVTCSEPVASAEVDVRREDAETDGVESEPVVESMDTTKAVSAPPAGAPLSSTLKSKQDKSGVDDNMDEKVYDDEIDKKDSTNSRVTEFDYSESLKAAFTQKGLTQFNEEVASRISNSADGILSNPTRRAGKLVEDYLENIKNEPSAEVRRKDTERSLLEPPNEAVRASLFDWYQGKCQICGDTWPKRDGNPYFAAAYIVERQNKRWLDEPGNSLCLCARHFSQWRLATKLVTTEITEQISALKLDSEGGNGDLKLRFQLVDRVVDINFCERHALALRKLVEVANCPKNDLNISQIISQKPDQNISINEFPPDTQDVLTDSTFDTLHSSQAICPYCQVLVNKNRLEAHKRSKCPKRPSITATKYHTSKTSQSVYQHQTRITNATVVAGTNTQSSKVTNGRLRCKFCSGFAMAGSDVCYSCA